MKPFLPIQAYFEVTRTCNQACPFCSCPWFAEKHPLERPEMEISEWVEASSELIANGLRHIALTGGEPTLKDGLPKLLRHIAAQLSKHHGTDSTLALFTNGHAVGHEWFDILADCNAEIYTSLPALSEFSRQTGLPDGDFRDVLTFIHEAVGRGFRVSVGITITKPMMHELYETLSYAILSGADAIVLNLFKPSGRGASHPELLLSEDDIHHVASIAEEIMDDVGNGFIIGGEFPPIVNADDHPRLSLTNHCIAAKSTFTIGPDGWLHVCEHAPQDICHWRNWRTVIQSDRWLHFLSNDLPICPLFN
ncbi:MAG: radical SAM protein [Victivallales bacterium]|nr:radical SAM protein [Victivallales bacterium]